MVNNKAEVAEQWEETKKTTKRRKKPNKKEEEEEGTPLRGIFCLKTRQDMKIFEDKEDCFILDFDPNDSFDAKKATFPDNTEDDSDLEIVHETGQVACRDYPHPRHLCLKYPFETTQHSLHCNQCYCYVCDVAAPCSRWTPNYEPHCEALENTRWKRLRELFRWTPNYEPHCEALENTRWKRLRELFRAKKK